MAQGRTFDILMIDADESNQTRWPRSLASRIDARISVHSAARSALTSFSRTRFDAVVCGQQLADTDCWRFIRMVRSGRFGGFPDTPVFVACDPSEFSALQPMLDFHTRLVSRLDPQDIAASVANFEVSRVKASVLVIEDEALAAQAAARALEKYFEVDIEFSGSAGLDTWLAVRHDLVLLDLMLPDIPGTDILHRILAEVPDQPIIIITAADATERHRDLMLAGATEFLTKPLDLYFLASRCHRALRDKACLSSAAAALDNATELDELSARLHAANYVLTSGRTHEATRHLQQALKSVRARGPSDDQWAALLDEFSLSRNR